MDDDRLLAKAVRNKYDERSEGEGDILSDSPKTASWDELKAWSQPQKEMEDESE